MYLIMGQYCWGKGETLQEAKAAWKHEGGKLSRGYVIITYGEGSTFEGVDGMGRYFWSGNEPTQEVVHPRQSA